MAAGGSTRVVVLALAANMAIAVVKFIAAVVTRSGSMMAEAVHSLADSGNQGLLLLGGKRAARVPDARHPLGYGREAYFWALLVAIILFLLGGAFSLYEGVHKLQASEPLRQVGWAVGVLVIGCVLEGYSLRAAWLECARVRAGQPLLTWSRSTGDVNLLVVVFEDLAAMAGLGLALIAVLLSWITGNPMFDALGSCVIGVLLLVVAVFLASLVRRLIIGLGVGRALREGIEATWAERGFVVLNLHAVWNGPHRILVACKVRPGDSDLDAAALMHAINAAEVEVRARFPQVSHQFVEPDFVK
ncbi:MAG: cation diffusion facilitator family transporter [Planctomycetota bacterium]|nr:cation diffusion facilitator family transporter [Planctomycetota bacterium]